MKHLIFNSSKFWVILLIASWLVGHIFVKGKTLLFLPVNRTPLALISFFIISLVGSLLYTDLSYTGLYGDNMRRNGFLTYLALSIIFLSTIKYFNASYIKETLEHRCHCFFVFCGPFKYTWSLGRFALLNPLTKSADQVVITATAYSAVDIGFH